MISSTPTLKDDLREFKASENLLKNLSFKNITLKNAESQKCNYELIYYKSNLINFSAFDKAPGCIKAMDKTRFEMMEESESQNIVRTTAVTDEEKKALQE